MQAATDTQEDYLHKLRHSTAHVMAQAVQELFPGTKLTIGPPIEDGFYYDFDSPHPFVPEDLKKIETRMREIAKRNHAFVMSTHSSEEAKKFMVNMNAATAIGMAVQIVSNRALFAGDRCGSRPGRPVHPSGVCSRTPVR